MPNIVLHKHGKLHLGLLWQFGNVSRQLDKERSKFDTFLDSVNLGYDSMARQFPDLCAQLFDLRRQASLMETGVARDESWIPAQHQEVFNTDEATKMICRRLYRKLAQVLHPDKGGDPGMFASLHVAYRTNDLMALNMMHFNLKFRNDLYWRQCEGLEFAKERRDLITVNTVKIRASPQFSAVSLYQRGRKDQALSIVENTLRAEIQNTLLRIEHKKRNYGNR